MSGAPLRDDFVPWYVVLSSALKTLIQNFATKGYILSVRLAALHYLCIWLKALFFLSFDC